MALRLAGWWWRVLAAIVDSLILMVPFSVLQNWIMGSRLDHINNFVDDTLGALVAGTALPTVPPELMNLIMLNVALTMLMWAVYRIVMVARSGGTLGQLATGLRVARDGDPELQLVGWGTAVKREGLAVLFQQIPLFGILNVLAPVVSRKNQTFHDMIAKTVVVKK